jgi:hypothetical protein
MLKSLTLVMAMLKIIYLFIFKIPTVFSPINLFKEINFSSGFWELWRSNIEGPESK